MNTESNTAETTETPPNISAVPAIAFKQEKFVEGDWQGFSFHTPVFGTLDAAKEHFGDAHILALVNTQVSSRLRNKVKNGLPKNLKGRELEDYKQNKLRQHPDGVLLSQEHALAWKPDAREESSTSIFKDIKDLLKSGKPQDAIGLFPKFIEALQREGGSEINMAEVLAAAAK